MNNIKFIFILFCSLISFYTFGNDFEQTSVENVSIAFKTFEEKGEKIWPSFHPDRYPLAIHFSNGHLYGFGWESPSPKWEKRKVKGYSVLYCSAWDQPLVPFHAAFPLDNRNVFLISFDHQDLSLFTLIHELFHTYQFHSFQKIKGKAVPPTDFSREQLVLIELENRLLTRYLLSENRDNLKDYFAVNRERRMKMEHSSIRWEDQQQRMEGLADYVSLKLCSELTSIAHAKEMLLKMREQKLEGSLKEDGQKGRHYFVGAAIAFALDESQVPHWKEKIEQGNSLQQLLEESLEGETGSVEQAKKQFNGKEIAESIDLRLHQEKESHQKHLAHFHNQEGVFFHVTVPKGPLSIGGRHEKSCPIEEDKTLMQKDISAITSGDQQWKLTFHEIPFVIEDREGNRTFKMALPLTLTLDHQKIELQHLLKEDKVIPFNSLSFQNEHCTFSSSKKGKIIAQEGDLFFVFD